MDAAKEFAKFMDDNPTVFHFTAGIQELLANAGFVEYSERDPPKLERGGKYFVQRNGSSLIAFHVGKDFVPGPDGYSIIASHIDANRLSLKPNTKVPDEQGFLRLGSAFYAGPNTDTWWDRDLGLGGRVIVKTKFGYASKLIRLPGTVGSIPSLAGHFGSAVADIRKANFETNVVPVVSASSELDPPASQEELASPISKKHPLQLLRAIAEEANCRVEDIVDMELELFSDEKANPAAGLGKNLLYSSRMDDKLCSFVAIKALIESEEGHDHTTTVVALYDNEEIGSLSRTGAQNKLMEVLFNTISRSLHATVDDEYQALGNSIALSADVTHAVNPNYVHAYSENLMPKLNTGMTIKQLGRFTSNSIDSAICRFISDRAEIPLQVFAPRNDTASGGTIGPIRAASNGIRTIDVGIPVLSMHSIREITGTKDVELGIKWFKTFFDMADELTE